MRTVGIGIDLVSIGRIERALDLRPRLAGRLFTDSELAEAGDRRRPGRHLAARFAAKEAVIKALPGGPFPIADIEILGGPEPRVILHNELAREARSRGLTISISLTHEREMAGAVALAEVRDGS